MVVLFVLFIGDTSVVVLFVLFIGALSMFSYL